MGLFPGVNRGIQSNPPGLVHGSSTHVVEELDGYAHKQGQGISHSRDDGAGAEVVDNDLVTAPVVLRQLQDPCRDEQLAVAVPQPGMDVLGLVEVGDWRLACREAPWLEERGAAIHPAPCPRYPRGLARRICRCLEEGQEFQREENVGDVVDLHVHLVAASCLPPEGAETGVEHGYVQLRELGLDIGGELLHPVEVHGIEVENLDPDLGILGEKLLLDCFSHFDVADGEYERREVVLKELVADLAADAPRCAGHQSGLAGEVDAPFKRRNGRLKDTHWNREKR